MWIGDLRLSSLSDSQDKFWVKRHAEWLRTGACATAVGSSSNCKSLSLHDAGCMSSVRKSRRDVDYADACDHGHALTCLETPALIAKLNRRSMAKRTACTCAAWAFAISLLVVATHRATASVELNGLGYSPFGQSTFCLDEKTIASDIAQIATLTQRIRLYGCACASTDYVMQYAQAHQLQVLVGVWINGDEQSNEQEMVGLQRLITKWGPYGLGLIVGVAAGNEVLSVNGGQLAYLLQYMDRIRSIIQPYGLPLTYVDIPEVWLGTHSSMAVTPVTNTTSTLAPGAAVVSCPTQLPTSACALLRRVDWVGANIHPYYSGLPVTCDGLNITGCYDAPSWVLTKVQELQRKLGTANVVVTEVGFPTAGEACCGFAPAGFPATARYLAQPSVNNSALHLAKLTQTLESAGDTIGYRGVTYFYFEAFDAAWKRTWSPCQCSVPPHNLLDGCVGSCTYDYNWGLWDSSRRPKAGIDTSAYKRAVAPPPLGSSSAPGSGPASAGSAVMPSWMLHVMLAVVLLMSVVAL